MNNGPFEVRCEVCGKHVDIDDTDGTGILIEFVNFLPMYREKYGFCPSHTPAENKIDDLKNRIKEGLDPVPPSGNFD